MSLEAERACLTAFFKTAWDSSTFSSVPVIWDNQSIKQSSGDFVMHRIADSDGKQVEIAGLGPALHRYIGLIQIDILSPVGTGTATARKMADFISDLHRRKQLKDSAGGVMNFTTPSIRSLGTINERYRLTVTCPYRRDIRH